MRSQPTPPVTETPPRLDAFIPPEMAARAEAVGVTKATMGPRNTILLAVMAGAFIAFGAIFSTVVATNAGVALPYGIGRLLSGLVFSVGLILVVVAGAELFTGNNLIIMAWANRRISSRQLLRNWALVFIGNFLGALLIAGLMFLTGQYTFATGAVGLTALNIAAAKTGLGLVQAFTLGIMCNVLVCLAVWLCFSARTTSDKILSILFPISAFVAAGFEHSVANMYFIPMGLLIKSGAPDSFWTAIGRTAADFPTLTWDRFLCSNLLPVTAGNIFGGSVLVGLVYWFIYIRVPKVPIFPMPSRPSSDNPDHD